MVEVQEAFMSYLDNQFSLSKSLSIFGAIALVAASITTSACSDQVGDNAELGDDQISQATQENVTTSELTDDLDTYLGETVTIREEAQEVVGESAFLLDEDELFGGEEVLVINASGEGIFLVEGDSTEVQVTGEVRELITADVEREYDLDLDEELYTEYEQRPVIIAQSLALAPDPEDLTSEPELYYNRRIVVEGEVEEFWTSEIMSVDGEALFADDDLLVINPNANLDFTEDEEVVITGVLRPFVVSEIDRDYDLTWDLDFQQELEAEYTENPVFIADEVYPSAI